MTVGELITELSYYDKDLKVVVDKDETEVMGAYEDETSDGEDALFLESFNK